MECNAGSEFLGWKLSYFSSSIYLSYRIIYKITVYKKCDHHKNSSDHNSLENEIIFLFVKYSFINHQRNFHQIFKHFYKRNLLEPCLTSNSTILIDVWIWNFERLKKIKLLKFLWSICWIYNCASEAPHDLKNKGLYPKMKVCLQINFSFLREVV